MAARYDDDSFADATPPDDAGARPKESDDQDDGYEETLIPKSACPGMEVGDVITFRITAVLDDQYSAKYEGESQGEGEPEMSPERDEVAELMS